MRLHFGLHFYVENLESFLRLDACLAYKKYRLPQTYGVPCLLTFESDDLGGRVHDCAFGGDGSADRVAGVRHVDDDHLGGVADLLADAYELVTLHGESGEGDVRHVDADICELKTKRLVV